jgi:hypothetical protein
LEIMLRSMSRAGRRRGDVERASGRVSDDAGFWGRSR